MAKTCLIKNKILPFQIRFNTSGSLNLSELFPIITVC